MEDYYPLALNLQSLDEIEVTDELIKINSVPI